MPVSVHQPQMSRSVFSPWPRQDHEIGDGTTGVVVMAGALLEKAPESVGLNSKKAVGDVEAQQPSQQGCWPCMLSELTLRYPDSNPLSDRLSSSTSHQKP